MVIITGASSGLGEALAHTFYMAGCKVILCARRQEELERVRKDLLECHPVSRCFGDEEHQRIVGWIEFPFVLYYGHC